MFKPIPQNMSSKALIDEAYDELVKLPSLHKKTLSSLESFGSYLRISANFARIKALCSIQNEEKNIKTCLTQILNCKRSFCNDELPELIDESDLTTAQELSDTLFGKVKTAKKLLEQEMTLKHESSPGMKI